MRTFLLFALALGMLMPSAAAAQRQGDIDAINRLIDRYGTLEDAMDMNAQGQLMSADRVWIVQAAGRRTDQATNMRIQQATFDQLKKRFPGVQTFTEDRDRLIKLYGNGSVAVASFFRYTTTLLPPATPPEVAKEFGPQAVAISLVLEKRDSDWKIVHTHVRHVTERAGRAQFRRRYHASRSRLQGPVTDRYRACYRVSPGRRSDHVPAPGHVLRQLGMVRAGESGRARQLRRQRDECGPVAR